MLARAAQQAGATVLRAARVVSVDHVSRENWRVETSGAEGRRTLRGRVLVDATGRRAFVGRRLGAQAQVADRLMGAVAMLPLQDTEQSTLIEAAENGWWYSAPLPDSRMVVAYMTDADLWTGQGGWLERLREAPLTSRRCGDLEILPRLRMVSAASVLRQPPAGVDWLAAGDAAMAFDPLSGQGVYQALDSGIHAAGAVRGCLEGNQSGMAEYELRAKDGFEKYLRLRAHFYGGVERWPGSEFWQRRAGGRGKSNTSY
jgi:flavin-dependent dehydrogenase